MLAFLECACDLHAWMPSRHVRSLPAPPQFLNQEPPRPQQLILPDFAMAPHLEHKELIVVAVAGVHMCGHWLKTQREKHFNSNWVKMYLNTVNIELTFAGIRAFKPPVINVSPASTSAVIIPSTTRSATTDSPRFLKLAALWTLHLIINPRGND